MALREKTVQITAELDRLEEDRQDLAGKVADGDPDSSVTQARVDRGQQLDRYMTGLRWYRETYGDESITLGALTNGERHRVKDTADATGSSAARQNAYVAMGVREASFIEHDPEEISQSAFEDSVAAVADLDPGFVDWAERELGKLGRMDGETGNSFRELVAEKRQQGD